MSITLKTEFYVNSVDKMENRDGSLDRKGTQVSYGLIDNKSKNRKDGDYKPITNIYLTVIDTEDAGIEFGKKYKVTFEEIK